MSGSDELWPGGAGAYADGTPGPRDLDGLLTALRQPGTPDELAREEAIVAAMEDVLGGRGGLRSAPSGSGRLVRRITVAKGVALAGVVAFGVAAAAATTGVVDLGRMPGWADDPPRQAPATPPASDTRGGAGSGSVESGDDERGEQRDETPSTTASTEVVILDQGEGDEDAPGPDIDASDGDPTGTAPETTVPTTTVPASGPGGSGAPPPADPPEPPVTLPPPPERDKEKDKDDPPPCRQQPSGPASPAPPPCDRRNDAG